MTDQLRVLSQFDLPQNEILCIAYRNWRRPFSGTDFATELRLPNVI